MSEQVKRKLSDKVKVVVTHPELKRRMDAGETIEAWKIQIREISDNELEVLDYTPVDRAFMPPGAYCMIFIRGGFASCEGDCESCGFWSMGDNAYCDCLGADPDGTSGPR